MILIKTTTARVIGISTTLPSFLKSTLKKIYIHTPEVSHMTVNHSSRQHKLYKNRTVSITPCNLQTCLAFMKTFSLLSSC